MGVWEKVGVFDSQSGNSQGILIHVLGMNPQSFTKYIETNASLRTILLSFVKKGYLLLTNRPEC